MTESNSSLEESTNISQDSDSEELISLDDEIEATQIGSQKENEFTLIQKNIENDDFVVVTLTEIRKGTGKKFVEKIKGQCLENIYEEEAYDITYLRNYRNHQDLFVFLEIPDDSVILKNDIIGDLINFSSLHHGIIKFS